jgi:hypothetical protein
MSFGIIPVNDVTSQLEALDLATKNPVLSDNAKAQLLAEGHHRADSVSFQPAEITTKVQEAQLEALIKEVCAYDIVLKDFISKKIPYEKRIPFLLIAKPITLHLEHHIAKSLVFEIIEKIEEKERETALAGMPDLMKSCSNMLYQVESLKSLNDRLTNPLKNGAFLLECIPLLLTFPVYFWKGILTSNVNFEVVKNSAPFLATIHSNHDLQVPTFLRDLATNNYSATTLTNAQLLAPLLKNLSVTTAVLRNIASIPEEKQAEIIKDALLLLRNIKVEEFILEEVLAVVQSPIHQEIKTLTDLLPPNTPAQVLTSICRMFKKQLPDKHAYLQELIADTLQKPLETTLTQTIHNLELNIDIRLVSLQPDSSAIAEVALLMHTLCNTDKKAEPLKATVSEIPLSIRLDVLRNLSYLVSSFNAGPRPASLEEMQSILMTLSDLAKKQVHLSHLILTAWPLLLHVHSPECYPQILRACAEVSTAKRESVVAGTASKLKGIPPSDFETRVVDTIKTLNGNLQY